MEEDDEDEDEEGEEGEDEDDEGEEGDLADEMQMQRLQGEEGGDGVEMGWGFTHVLHPAEAGTGRARNGLHMCRRRDTGTCS